MTQKSPEAVFSEFSQAINPYFFDEQYILYNYRATDFEALNAIFAMPEIISTPKEFLNKFTNYDQILTIAKVFDDIIPKINQMAHIDTDNCIGYWYGIKGAKFALWFYNFATYNALTYFICCASLVLSGIIPALIAYSSGAFLWWLYGVVSFFIVFSFFVGFFAGGAAHARYSKAIKDCQSQAQQTLNELNKMEFLMIKSYFDHLQERYPSLKQKSKLDKSISFIQKSVNIPIENKELDEDRFQSELESIKSNLLGTINGIKGVLYDIIIKYAKYFPSVDSIATNKSTFYDCIALEHESFELMKVMINNYRESITKTHSEITDKSKRVHDEYEKQGSNRLSFIGSVDYPNQENIDKLIKECKIPDISSINTYDEIVSILKNLDQSYDIHKKATDYLQKCRDVLKFNWEEIKQNA